MKKLLKLYDQDRDVSLELSFMMLRGHSLCQTGKFFLSGRVGNVQLAKDDAHLGQGEDTSSASESAQKHRMRHCLSGMECALRRGAKPCKRKNLLCWSDELQRRPSCCYSMGAQSS